MLGWTKVRLLARLPHEEDDAAWIDYARRVTAEELSRVVREVDRGSVEAGAAAEDGAKSRMFEVRCSPEVRWKWYAARSAAARAAGRVLHPSEAAELIAAEVLSALPMDENAGDGRCDEAGVSWSEAGEAAAAAAASEGCEEEEGRGPGEGMDRGGPRRRGRAAGPAPRPPWWGDGVKRSGSPEPRGSVPPPSYPPVLQPFLVGLEDADAFELDDRLRRALAREQRLDARVGPLLTVAWEHWVHRALGYATREAYARERLGMDPTRARALVRLERVAGDSRAFAEAYRSGALSWVRADVLAPLVAFDPLGRFVDEWVAWAGRVTVRRLREDVEEALALAETDPRAFRRDGGLPPEAREEREIGAQPRGAEGHSLEADAGRSAPRRAPQEEDAVRPDREIGAQRRGAEGPRTRGGHPPEECWARFIGPADIVQLFQAVLRTVRRRVERDTGRLPTPGEALGVMLDHVFSAWGEIDGKVAARHRVFARDGWRCAVPGCTSMQNLHDHHIRFRSAGGEDSPDNRITAVRLPPPAGRPRRDPALRGPRARRAALGDGAPTRRVPATRLPLRDIRVSAPGSVRAGRLALDGGEVEGEVAGQGVGLAQDGQDPFAKRRVRVGAGGRRAGRGVLLAARGRAAARRRPEWRSCSTFLRISMPWSA